MTTTELVLCDADPLDHGEAVYCTCYEDHRQPGREHLWMVDKTRIGPPPQYTHMLQQTWFDMRVRAWKTYEVHYDVNNPSHDERRELTAWWAHEQDRFRRVGGLGTEMPYAPVLYERRGRDWIAIDGLEG